ncbi:hypothetical protein MKX01_036460 [Papaver californicum]|nr:hypothetical protein MKX01_036460 [Papaver californicum]
MKKGPALFRREHRVSVRDLADKFEKGFADAEAVGKSDEVADLSVKLAQSEGEFSQEKEHVKIQADFLKQATEDTKRLVDEKKPLLVMRLRLLKLQCREGLKIQDARRIKMLHQHSKLTMKTAPDLSECSVQWYRICSEDKEKKMISGATKLVYAPEPFDVGQILLVDFVVNGQRLSVQTNAPGLGSYIEELVRISETKFNVVVIQMNGESKRILFYFNAAALSLFWQAKEGLSFVLAFESDRERNAAIMFARRFAFDWSIALLGPGDSTIWNG